MTEWKAREEIESFDRAMQDKRPSKIGVTELMDDEPGGRQ